MTWKFRFPKSIRRVSENTYVYTCGALIKFRTIY